ncbi:MAG: PKD domain-containing protein [Bacteroidota bacterium]
MRIFFTLWLSLFFILCSLTCNAEGPVFIENKGQWNEKVLFRVDYNGLSIFLLEDGIIYDLYDSEATSKFHNHNLDHKESNHKVLNHAVRMSFMNSQKPVCKGLKEVSNGSTNYFLGSDPSRWASNVKSYSEINYSGIYNGVDLKFYFQQGRMKYDIKISPEASVKDIEVKYFGADNIFIDEGNLRIETSLGPIVESIPYSYLKHEDGNRTTVECSYSFKKNKIAFDLDLPKTRETELVIDPILIFSTYSGSFADNWGFTATFDEAGNAYSGGIVRGNGFPTTDGAYDETFNQGGQDIAIIKYDSAGENILYATHLGGNGTDIPHSIVVNAQNELIIFGTTSSANFPTSLNAFDRTFSGGDTLSGLAVNNLNYFNGSDLIISKLSSDGSNLLASTFLGGSENDGVLEGLASTTTPVINPIVQNYGDQFRGDVIVDETGAIYIASNTKSVDFPIVNGLFDTKISSDVTDGVVAKLSSNLSQIIWSTYLGGSENDAAFSIRFDNSLNTYIGGATESQDFTITPGAAVETSPNNLNGFVTAISNDGNSLMSSTFIGSEGDEQVYFLDLDPAGDVFVMGNVLNGTIPISDSVYNNPNSGQYIQKLSSDLSEILLSTTVGSGDGNKDFSPTAFLVNECGNIYVSGWGSPNASFLPPSGDTRGLPVTENAEQATTDGSDLYLMVLGQELSSLLTATYFGGTGVVGDHVDGGTSRFDDRGIVYQTVCASCGFNDRTDFPTTPNAVSQRDNSPNCNSVVFKFDLSALLADFETFSPDGSNEGIDVGCVPATFLFRNRSIGGEIFTWDFGDGTTSNLEDSILHTYNVPGTYEVILTIEDINTCRGIDVARKALNVFVPNFTIMNDTTICEGDRIQLMAEGAGTYSWSPNTNIINANTSSPTVFPDTTTTYYVEAVDGNGCIFRDSVIVEVTPTINVDFITNTEDGLNPGILSGCRPFTFLFNNTSIGSEEFTWDFGDGRNSFLSDSLLITYESVGVFEVTLTSRETNECPGVFSSSETIQIFEPNFSLIPDTTICFGDSLELFALGAGSYSWSPEQSLLNPFSSNPTVFPDTTITYFVEAIDGNGCIFMDSVQVEVIPKIVTDFMIDTTFSCLGGNNYQFTNLSTGASEYLWKFGDGTSSTDFDVTHRFETDSGQIYNVVLNASQSFCSEEKLISILDIENKVPNVITPGNDGLNEFFTIQSNTSARVLITDRWGRTLVDEFNYENDWNAQDQSGGVYFYDVTFPDGTNCNGWLHVLKTE